jgi:hypothetical protein
MGGKLTVRFYLKHGTSGQSAFGECTKRLNVRFSVQLSASVLLHRFYLPLPLLAQCVPLHVAHMLHGPAGNRSNRSENGGIACNTVATPNLAIPFVHLMKYLYLSMNKVVAEEGLEPPTRGL